MKNQGTRFRSYSTLGFLASTACMMGYCSLVVGQQGVAPPAAGYGNRTAAPTNQLPGGSQTGGSQPSGDPVGRATPAPINPNPAFNPALNQRPGSNPPQNAGSGKEVVTKDPYGTLPPQEQTYLDQVLNKWEQETANIERYSCKFIRWQYNSSENFVDELAKKLGRDIRTVNVSSASGELKYMAPDKGMFKIDKLLKLSGQLDPKDPTQPEFKDFNKVFGEWWLCDGEKVYEYDRSEKKCTRYTMPPELKGAGILESPMPFMFGVKAEKIKARYWVRPLASPLDQQGKPLTNIYVIEAYPKFQADATNYDHVQIYLDREMYLPVMLIKYNTDHLDQPNEILKDNREVFQFSDRISEGPKNLIKKIGEMFHKSFIPSDIPKDWTVEDRVFAPPAMDNIRSANNPAAPQPNNAPNMRK